MDRNKIKKIINWVGILIAAHLAAMIAFSIFLSGSLVAIAEKEPHTVSLSVFLFDVVFQIFFLVLFVNIETSFVEYRRKMRESLRENDFTAVEYFKKNHLRDDIVKLICFTAFQIPFTIFFIAFKFSILAATSLEKFYVLDAGTYLLTGSAILGFLLNSLLFGAIYLSVRLASLAILKKRL